MNFPLFKQQGATSNPAGLVVNTWEDGRPLFRQHDFQAQIDANTEWVYRAVQIIAETCSSTPFRLYTVQNKTSKALLHKSRTLDKAETEYNVEHSTRIAKAIRNTENAQLIEIVDHPLIDLLHKANPIHNGADLNKLKFTYERLTGNAYWLKERNGLGAVEQLWPLHTPNVAVVPSSIDFIKGYEYRKADGGKVFFEKEDVIHFFDPSVFSPYYGSSPLSACVDAVTLKRYMNKFSIDLFHNQAIPQTVLLAKGKVTKAQSEDIKSAWKRISGFVFGNTGGNEAVILPNDTVPHTLTMPPKDLDYGEGKISERNTIFGVYGVPITKADPSEVRANTEAADTQMARDTIRPLLVRDEEKLNQDLVMDFEPSGSLIGVYDDPVPADKAFRLKADTEDIKSGARLRDEVRAARGLDPLPDGTGAFPPPFQGTPQGEPVTDEGKAFANKLARDVARVKEGLTNGI